MKTLAGIVVVSAVARCDFGETYPCGEPTRVCVESAVVRVGEALVDFESGCADPSCGAVVVAGSVSVGPSFHPGDHALVFAPDTTAEVPVEFQGRADGATLAVNARCDHGSTLHFQGDGVSVLDGAEGLVTDAPVWRRRSWSLREAATIRDSPEEARAGTTALRLRFATRGAGRCQLDRVVYLGTARVCTRYELRRQQCVRWSTREGSEPEDAGRSWGP